MAGKTKDMSQIKQLLLLKKEGVSNRKAAEIVGINKETANNYVGSTNFRQVFDNQEINMKIFAQFR